MENSSLPTKNPEDTVTFKRNHFYSIMVVFAFAVGILVGYVAWGVVLPEQRAASPANSAAQVQPNAPVQAPAEPEDPEYIRYDIPTEGFPSLGPEDAEIVLVEFSDYQ